MKVKCVSRTINLTVGNVYEVIQTIKSCGNVVAYIIEDDEGVKIAYASDRFEDVKQSSP